MVDVVAITLVIAVGIGYRHNQNKALTGIENNNNVSSEHWRLLHQRLSLYFLLRYAVPITRFILYSCYCPFPVFESELEFGRL